MSRKGEQQTSTTTRAALMTIIGLVLIPIWIGLGGPLTCISTYCAGWVLATIAHASGRNHQ